MSELLDQINTDTNKEAISVKEITKALESWFFDTQENITTMIQELDHIDNALEHSCVQSLLKVAYTQPLYDKLQHYPELMQRLQVWSQEQYMNNLSLDEKKIGWLSLISLPKKPEDVTITTLSKYINTANTLPEHHDMLVKVLQEQMKLLNQLCPDKKSLLDMTWNSKKNWLDAPILKITTLQQLSDRIKKEAQVRKEYEAIKSTSLKQIDPWKLSKDVLKLWTITKLSTFPTELKTLDTESAFAQFLQKNQNDVFYWPILQQYVGIRLQPYIQKEESLEYVSATIDKENPELKNYVVGTTFWKKYLGETYSSYKNYKEQQQNLAKFHLTWATAEQITTFQRKRNNHQARIKPEYLKKIQDEEDRRIAQIRANSRRNSRADGWAAATAWALMAASWKVDKYIYDSVVTLTKDYVTLLLQTSEGKKLLKEKKYIDNPFMPGMRLNFAKGDVESIVRDSFFEKFGDGIDDFKKAWQQGKREEVWRSIGSLVWGTVAAGATTILTWWSGVWAAGAAFTIGSRAWWSLWGMIWAGFEGKSWSEIGNAWLVWLWVGERDQNGTFVNYFKDAKGNVTQDSLLHGAWRMGISLGTDYLSSVATFGIGNKIWLDKWAGKFVGAWWKQFASQGAVFGAEELFIENFLVDIPANTLQAWVSSFFLGNAIQDVWPRSAKLSQNTNKQIDPNNPTATQWDIKAALGAMSTTFSQNISPENLGQTFAATLAYGGMLSWGRSAINKVAVALPALSVKNINDISISYQTQLTDLQTKFPTLSIGKDMNTLTLDWKVLDQTHPRFWELEWSLKALQVLGTSFSEEMDKISQIQQWLTDPQSPEAKKRWLIYGWKLLHPRMTPLEVIDGRIDKLKKEITTEKNSTTKSQKEALLQQMEGVKGEIEGKVEGTFIMSKSIKLPSWVIMDIQIITEEWIKKWQEIWWMPDIQVWDKIVQLHIDQNADIKKWFQEMKEQLLKLDDIKYVIGITYLTALGKRYGFDIKKWDKLLEKSSVKVWILDPLNSFFGKFLASKWMNVSDILTIKEQMKKEGWVNNSLYIEFKKYATENGSFSPWWTNADHIIGEKYVDMRLKYDVKDIGLMIATPSKLLNNDNSNANVVNTTPLEKNEQQEAHPANVNNRESVNKALEKLVNLIPTETLRRPNGSIGTQGFTEENFISVARHIAQEMNFTIPDYDKTSSVSEITQLIQYLKNNKEAQQKLKEYVIKDPVIVSLLPDNTYHIEDGNHRANLLNLIGVDVIPAIERNGRNIQDIINEHNAKVEKIEGRKTREVNENSADNSNQKTIETTQNIQPLFTKHTDLLKNIINPETLQTIIQSEMAAWNLVLNTDGSIKEVYTEVGSEKKPSQLFAKMKADWFSEQQALKTWLQVRTPEFKNRFGDRQNTDKTQVSKVVDENGEPLIIYRADINKTTFDVQRPNADFYWIYTTRNQNNAKEYIKGRDWKERELYSLFANIKNLYHTDKARDVYTINWEMYKDYIEKWFDWIYFETNSHPNVKWWVFNTIVILNEWWLKSAINNDWSFSPETAKFNDYFWKESRFWFDSKQARDHSTFMDQFSGQATVEQINQIRQKIEAVAQMYVDKTWKKLELTDTQIQAIIDTHFLPWQLWKLTQAELLVKNKKLAEAIPDDDLRRFLLEAGFCGINTYESSYVGLMQLGFTENEINSSLVELYGDVVIKLQNANVYLDKDDVMNINSISRSIIDRYLTLYEKYGLSGILRKTYTFELEYVNDSFEKKLNNYLSIKNRFDEINDWWIISLADIHRIMDDDMVHKFNILYEYCVLNSLKINIDELNKLYNIDLKLLKTYTDVWHKNWYLKSKWIDDIYSLLSNWKEINNFQSILYLDHTWFWERQKVNYQEYSYTAKEMIAYETMKVSYVVDRLEKTIHNAHATWQSIELAKLLTIVKGDLMELSLSNRIKIIEQVAHACQKIQAIHKHLDFENWHYKSPKELLIAMRWITDPDVLNAINCDITVEQYGVSVVFYVSDPKVYDIIYNKGFWPDSDSYWFSHGFSAIKDLEQTLTVCNWSKWSSKYLEGTKIHEDRHILYEYLQQDHKEDSEIDPFIRRAQNEIIAQWKWWKTIHSVRQTMIDGYDYISEYLAKNSNTVISDPKWNHNIQQEYDRLQGLYMAKLKESLDYLEKFNILWRQYPNINFSKEKIMNILSITPIQKRGKVYDIFSGLIEIWESNIEVWNTKTRFQTIKNNLINLLQTIKNNNIVKKILSEYNEIIHIIKKWADNWLMDWDEYYEKYYLQNNNDWYLQINTLDNNVWRSHTNKVENVIQQLDWISSIEEFNKIILDPQYSHIQYWQHDKISWRQIVAMISQIKEWRLPVESIPKELRSYVLKFIQ